MPVGAKTIEKCMCMLARCSCGHKGTQLHLIRVSPSRGQHGAHPLRAWSHHAKLTAIWCTCTRLMLGFLVVECVQYPRHLCRATVLQVSPSQTTIPFASLVVSRKRLYVTPIPAKRK